MRREKKPELQEFKNSWTPVGLTDVEREGMAVARVLEKSGAEHFDYTCQNNVAGRPRRGLTAKEESARRTMRMWQQWMRAHTGHIEGSRALRRELGVVYWPFYGHRGGFIGQTMVIARRVTLS